MYFNMKTSNIKTMRLKQKNIVVKCILFPYMIFFLSADFILSWLRLVQFNTLQELPCFELLYHFNALALFCSNTWLLLKCIFTKAAISTRGLNHTPSQISTNKHFEQPFWSYLKIYYYIMKHITKIKY